MFRIRLSLNNYVRLVILTLTTSLISLLMTYYSFYEGIRPFIILIITLIFINKVKETGFKTSLIVVSIAYVVFIAIQTLLFIIMHYYKLIPLEIVSFSYDGYLLQLITSIFLIITSTAIKFILKEGFMFDPDRKLNKKLKYSNRLFIIILVFAFASISSLYFEAVHSKLSSIVYAISIISLLFSISLFYLSIKRDQEEAELYFSILRKEVKKDEDEIF
jgi:hypothetical protein